MPNAGPLEYYEHPEAFREAIRFTESSTGFSARLIEKDYYCSLVLQNLSDAFQQGLVFKGGTCLSKVHTDFYRLSEDLDFAMSMETDSARSFRRERISPLKDMINGLPERVSCFRVSEPLSAHQRSRQYVGGLVYDSVISGQSEFIKIEISLREPVQDTVVRQPARTILIDPVRVRPALDPITVSVLSFRETFAEKFRAAMTRRDPAVRDYYDIDYAMRSGKLDVSDGELLKLVRQKLAISGNERVDVSDGRLAALQRQVEAQLKPVLRPEDIEEFDMERAFAIVAKFAARL